MAATQTELQEKKLLNFWLHVHGIAACVAMKDPLNRQQACVDAYNDFERDNGLYQMWFRLNGTMLAPPGTEKAAPDIWHAMHDASLKEVPVFTRIIWFLERQMMTLFRFLGWGYKGANGQGKSMFQHPVASVPSEAPCSVPSDSFPQPALLRAKKPESNADHHPEQATAVGPDELKKTTKL